MVVIEFLLEKRIELNKDVDSFRMVLCKLLNRRKRMEYDDDRWMIIIGLDRGREYIMTATRPRKIR
jgi:hypothetical protein